MSIDSIDDYLASAKQVIEWFRFSTRTSLAAQPFSLFDVAGQPGPGSLAAGNTANGIVPTDVATGYPTINAFGGGATGYLSRFNFSGSIQGRLLCADRLFVAGAYAFNANTTLASQPSYSSRVPGADYKGLEIWVECVTAFTGALSVVVEYTNAAGVSARSTGTVSVGALTLGRMVMLPLQAGDDGVMSIDKVTGSVASAGTFNVMVLRPLALARTMIAGSSDNQDMIRTGLPIVYADTALFFVFWPDATNTGQPDVSLEIANL